MDHVAILSSNIWLEKILSGQKTIESRWTKNRIKPFNSISKGDVVYFKVSGKPVSAVAKVSGTSFHVLTPAKAKEVFYKNYKKICDDLSYFDKIKDKRYCTLIKIKDARKIKPFGINKNGYGNAVAWMAVGDINRVKI